MNQSQCYDLRFPKATTHLIVGVSGAGKTMRTLNILRMKNELIVDGDSIQNVIFCYSAWQPIYEEAKSYVTKWINEMPTNEEFISMVKPYQTLGGSIVVLDDFLGAINKDMMEMVCVTARHYNVSLFILFQTLFPKDKCASTITRNVKFMHLHKNPRDNSQFRYLASQLAPSNFQWMVSAFHEATKEPFSCFLLDLTQKCPDMLRYRSHYLPEEAPMRVWKQAR